MNKRISSRGIIIKDNKLLTMFRKKNIDSNIITYYVIPGGGVEEGESLEDTVIREIKEELSLDVKVKEFVCKLEGKDISNFFLCEIVGGELKLGGEELNYMTESNYYEPMYIPLDKIKDINLLPKEIKDIIINKYVK